jgi:hypothetical protein
MMLVGVVDENLCLPPDPRAAISTEYIGFTGSGLRKDFK